MNIKKVKICLLDENDNTLRSSKVVLKWTDELEKDLFKFHNKKAEDEALDMLFMNITESTNNIATEEDWKEIKG